MKAIDEYRQRLVAELIEQSAKIDQLVVKFRDSSLLDMGSHYNQDLEALRAKQRETTNKLHASEVHSSYAWENIGSGG